MNVKLPIFSSSFPRNATVEAADRSLVVSPLDAANKLQFSQFLKNMPSERVLARIKEEKSTDSTTF